MNVLDAMGGKVAVGGTFYTVDGGSVVKRTLLAVCWQGMESYPDRMGVCKATGRAYPEAACFYTEEQAKLNAYQYARQRLRSIKDEVARYQLAVAEYESQLALPPAPETEVDVLDNLVAPDVVV